MLAVIILRSYRSLPSFYLSIFSKSSASNMYYLCKKGEHYLKINYLGSLQMNPLIWK